MEILVPAGARAAAVLLHGFTRRPAHLAWLAHGLASVQVATVRPALGSLDPRHAMQRTAVLDAEAPHILAAVPAGLPLVVVGHSAGAAAGTWLAADWRDMGADLRGIVWVDGVESPTRTIERAWPRLEGVPIVAISAPPSRCNRGAALGRWLTDRRAEAQNLLVPGSGHGDIEGPADGGGARAMYRWACGDVSDQATRARVRQTVIDQVLILADSGT